MLMRPGRVGRPGQPGAHSGGALLAAATAKLGGFFPLHYWDFSSDLAYFAGMDVGRVEQTPGWSVTRAGGPFYAPNAAGVLVPFSANTARRTDAGLLIEPSRTNLFLNSAVGATQDITVTAAVQTLSFYGTGTITLSGASTAGPLVGTGANNRVQLSFTPTAGPLTCTVSGSCTQVQLELGSQASSWIPTTGASVTRPTDIITIASPLISYPCTLWCEFERLGSTGGIETLFDLNAGSTTERVVQRIEGDLLKAFMISGGVAQADVGVLGTVALNTVYRAAGTFNTDRVQACRSATLGTADVLATLPAASTTLRLGSNSGGSQVGFLRMTQAAVLAGVFSDANLQALAP